MNVFCNILLLMSALVDRETLGQKLNVFTKAFIFCIQIMNEAKMMIEQHTLKFEFLVKKKKIQVFKIVSLILPVQCCLLAT